MARYEIAVQKVSGAAAGMICQLRTASTRNARLYELGVSTVTAVAGEVALVRPTAVGATFTSSAVGAAEDVSGAAASVAVIDTAATTPPTIGTNYMRRFQLPAAIGAGIIWTFPVGLVVPISASIALWQLSAAAVTYDVYAVWDE